MDWDDLVGGLAMALGVVLVGLGIVFIFAGTPDSAVVRACEQRGYWQTGQTRIICSVEAAK